MYHEVIVSILVSLLLLDLTWAAPTHNKANSQRQLTRYFTQLKAADGSTEGLLSRKRRSVLTDDKLDVYAQLDDADDYVGTPVRSPRRRRSAAFMLAAAIRLCNDYRHLCRTIKVMDRDQELTIQVTDE